MALFPSNGGTRLVHVRALGGDFPFYGTMETDRPSAGRDFRNGAGAVVEESLLIQFGAKAGDRIRIGDAEFTVSGAPEENAGRSFRRRLLRAAGLHPAATSG